MALTEEDKIWIADQIGALRGELLDRIEKTETGFLDRIERTETELLAEFHKWASPFECASAAILQL